MDKIVNKIWDIIKSVRLSILLFILLILAAMLGTFIPQQDKPPWEYIERLDPVVQQIYLWLQPYDLYHSTWFRLIMGLLALNLLACSMDRFPKSLQLLRAQPKADRSQVFQDLPEANVLNMDRPRDEVQKVLLDSLANQYREIHSRENESDFYAHAEKGRWSYLAVYLVHLSVILVLFGALLGSVFGFEGYVTLESGAVANTVLLRKTDLPMPIDFSVRCEKFEIDVYPDGTPRQYRTEISFLVDKKVIQQKTVEVNRPASFQGITFYQASFGAYLGESASLRISGPGLNADKKVEAEPGKAIPLPNGAQFRVLEITEDYMRLGPAVAIALQPEGQPEIQFWVFGDHDRVETIKKAHPGMLDSLLAPAEAQAYRFIVEKKYYTVLQAHRDPGIPLVWCGFLFLVLGLMATFFFSHRRVWVRLAEKEGKIILSFATRTNKNHIGAENALKRLMRRVRGT